MALLQFQSTAEYTIATLGISSPIAVEQKIIAAGFVDDNAKIIFTEGKISLLPDKSFQRGYRIGYSNKVQPGMSGGPILNYQGEVIGINAVHAYPSSDQIYVYSDNTKPSAAERKQMRQYSWGVPIYSVAKGVNEVIAQSPRNTNNSGLTAKKGLINDIDKIAQEITVLIPAADSIGSGVIIAHQGDTYYVLTADHVVWNRQPLYDKEIVKDKLEIVTPDNQRYAVNVSNINRMPYVDLAVVKFTSNQKYRVATLAKYGLENENQKVFVSGFPKSRNQKKNKPNRILTAGSLMKQERVRLNTYVSFFKQSSLENTSSTPSIQRRENETVLSEGYELLYSNITEGGMSGGAVLDTQGRVIGIHGRDEEELEDTKYKNINLGRSAGIPINTFLGFVKQVGIESDLKIETTLPATLKKQEEDLISEYLLPLDEVPKDSDDEISWVNYANQLWRSKRYPEAIKAVNKAIEKKPDFYQAWYLKGLIFSVDKKYPESIAAFDKAIQINPKFAQAWKLRGRSFINSDKYDKYSEALASFNQAIALSPNQFDLYFFRGNVYGDLEDYEQAIADYTQAIRLNPNDALSYYFRAFDYYKLKNYTQTIADYTEAIRLNPEKASYYWNRGWIYSEILKNRDYKQAIADYTKAIKLDPENARYYWSRGEVYNRLNEKKKAEADYRKAVGIKPKNAGDYETRGDAYLSLKEYKQAIADYTEAIKLDPKNAQHYWSRGTVYTILIPQDYKQAIADYTEAIKLDPKNAEYYKFRGDAYSDNVKVKDRDYKQAIADYTQAIKFDPENSLYYFVRGLTYSRLKKYKLAIADYTQAIIFNPEEAVLYGNRGDAYSELQEYQQAIDDYNQAIKIKPEDAFDIIRNRYSDRGFAHFQLKNYKQAIDDYTQAIKINPKNAGYYWIRGAAYVELKNYKQAIDDCTIAVQLKSDFADAYYIRGFANYKLKDYQQAINDWNQAIKFKPDYHEAYTNLGIVRYEMGEVETAINHWQNAVKINSNFAEAHLALGVALYAKGDKEAGLKSGEMALKLDKSYGNIEFLKKNGWGDKLIKDSQEFLNNPRIKSLI